MSNFVFKIKIIKYINSGLLGPIIPRLLLTQIYLMVFVRKGSFAQAASATVLVAGCVPTESDFQF